MPSRNRIIYQSKSLHVGPTGCTGMHFNSGNSGFNLITTLHRVQSLNHDWSVNRLNINQFGELAAIDRVIIDSPTVTLGFSYILANLSNEKKMGFTVDNSANCLSGLSKRNTERNYFVKVVEEGIDAVGDATVSTGIMTRGFGNCFLTSYSTQGAVGGLPTADVRLEGLNMTLKTGVHGTLPAVDPINGTQVTQFVYTLPTSTSNAAATGDFDIAALRPGDITLTFAKRDAEDEGILSTATGVYDLFGPNLADSEARIQSYTLSFDMARDAVQKLGSRFAVSREIRFPIDVNLSVDVVATDLTTGVLFALINCDNSYDVKIKLFKPDGCSASARTSIIEYNLKNAKINGQSFSNGIGDNETVKLDFTAQMGGPGQSNVGLYLSGLHTGVWYNNIWY